jgi:hypothetical protein
MSKPKLTISRKIIDEIRQFGRALYTDTLNVDLHRLQIDYDQNKISDEAVEKLAELYSYDLTDELEHISTRHFALMSAVVRRNEHYLFGSRWLKGNVHFEDPKDKEAIDVLFRHGVLVLLATHDRFIDYRTKVMERYIGSGRNRLMVEDDF